MKKLLTINLIGIAILTLAAFLLGDGFPALIKPYAGIAWRTYFVESPAATRTFFCAMTLIAGAAAFGVAKGVKWVYVLCGICGGLLVLLDFSVPLRVFFAGGADVLTPTGALTMLTIGIFTDVIPFVCGAALAVRKSERVHI
jgi:hypothetical protein